MIVKTAPVVLPVLIETIEYLIAIQNLTLAFILQFLLDAKSIDAAFHAQLIILQQAKTSKDGFTLMIGLCRIGYLHSRSLYIVSTIHTGERCFQKGKLGIVRQFVAEIIFKEQRSDIAHHLLLGTTCHHLRGDVLFFALIIHFCTLHKIAIEYRFQFILILFFELLVEWFL